MLKHEMQISCVWKVQIFHILHGKNGQFLLPSPSLPEGGGVIRARLGLSQGGGGIIRGRELFRGEGDYSGRGFTPGPNSTAQIIYPNTCGEGTENFKKVLEVPHFMDTKRD